MKILNLFRILNMYLISRLFLNLYFLNYKVSLFYLPRNSSQGEEQHVVGIVPLVPRRDGSDPVAAFHRDRLHGLVHPGIGNADDLNGGKEMLTGQHVTVLLRHFNLIPITI